MPYVNNKDADGPDQHFCYSLHRQYNSYRFSIKNFMTLVTCSFWSSWAVTWWQTPEDFLVSWLKLMFTCMEQYPHLECFMKQIGSVKELWSGTDSVKFHNPPSTSIEERKRKSRKCAKLTTRWEVHVGEQLFPSEVVKQSNNKNVVGRAVNFTNPWHSKLLVISPLWV